MTTVLRMPAAMLALVLGLAAVTATAAPAAGADAPATATRGCTDQAGWDDPTPPRRIHGDTWYVGTCGITAVLVTSPQGHILLDGGTANGAALIADNIRAAGFRIEDVRWIGGSHEHFDHAGGIAALQAASGATVVAREPAARVLERGRSDRGDPQYAQLEPLAPVARVSGWDIHTPLYRLEMKQLPSTARIVAAAKRTLAATEHRNPTGVVQALLGHRDQRSTVVYTLPDRQDLIDAMEAAY